MPVRERSVDRSEAMALFEMVHRHQLEMAYNTLRLMYPGSRWRIALQEKIFPVTMHIDEAAPCDMTMYLIELRLDRNGRMLEIADEGSQRAIEGWEERNHDALPWHFTVPIGDSACP